MKKLRLYVEHWGNEDEEFIARFVHDYRFSACTLTYWEGVAPPNRWTIDICYLSDLGVEDTKKRLLELDPPENTKYDILDVEPYKYEDDP